MSTIQIPPLIGGVSDNGYSNLLEFDQLASPTLGSGTLHPIVLTRSQLDYLYFGANKVTVGYNLDFNSTEIDLDPVSGNLLEQIVTTLNMAGSVTLPYSVRQDGLKRGMGIISFDAFGENGGTITPPTQAPLPEERIAACREVTVSGLIPGTPSLILQNLVSTGQSVTTIPGQPDITTDLSSTTGQIFISFFLDIIRNNQDYYPYLDILLLIPNVPSVGFGGIGAAESNLVFVESPNAVSCTATLDGIGVQLFTTTVNNFSNPSGSFNSSMSGNVTISTSE